MKGGDANVPDDHAPNPQLIARRLIGLVEERAGNAVLWSVSCDPTAPLLSR